MNDYYVKNKERILERLKNNYQDNRDKLLARSRKYYENNRDKLLAKSIEYRKNNRDKLLMKSKKYYYDNRDKLLMKSKKYYYDNRDKLLAKSIEYQKNNDKSAYLRQWRLNNSGYMKLYQHNQRSRVNAIAKVYRLSKKDDVNYKISNNIRRRIYDAIKKDRVIKSSNTLKLLGCDITYFKKYIEKQFEDSMSWDNYGSVWWVDHRIPLTWFDLSVEEEQFRAFNYNNCKPMFASDNISKSNRYAEPSLIQIFGGN